MRAASANTPDHPGYAVAIIAFCPTERAQDDDARDFIEVIVGSVSMSQKGSLEVPSLSCMSLLRGGRHVCAGVATFISC